MTATLPGIRRVEHVMGMPIVVDLRDALADARSPGRRVRRVPRGGRDASAPTGMTARSARLNRGELAPADAHPDVREIIERCERLRAETRGYFDIHARLARRRSTRPGS